MLREEVEAADKIPFQQQTENFVRITRGVEEPRCSGDDGLASVKVCEAVIEALTKRDWMPILIK